MSTQRFRLGLLGLGSVAVGLTLAAVLTGCDYSAPRRTGAGPYPGSSREAPGDVATGPDATGGESPAATSPGDASGPCGGNPEILANVINLIQNAALKPGGDNFRIATQNLNQYFRDKKPADFALAPEVNAFLLEQMPEPAVRALENPAFRMPDARHMEDCMLYYMVATRVGGIGDDLSRVRRVFRWLIEQVQLVKDGSLAAPGLGQAQARPYDVLMRGMATEVGGSWAERAWVFMVLCRQLGVDVGLLSYTPAGGKAPVVWTCAALIDGRLYLFDTRIGLEVPGPGGDGVATLDDALNDPAVLARLDLPGQSPYGTTREALLGSASKIGVLLDSSPDYRSPRMAMLQECLAGKNRTLLYRDPVVERDAFLKVLGARAGKVGFWELPAMVEALLFNDPRFVQATQHALVLFDPNRYPLVYARIKQLRGELSEAITEYVDMRFAMSPTMVDKKTPIPAEIQQALDAYATYFLALCDLEQGRHDRAREKFEQALRMLPEPGRGQPFYNMFRWGAQANLARLCEARKDFAQAIAYYTQVDPTSQRHGNLVRARDLVWLDPTAPVPPALPPAPAHATAPPALIAAPPAK